MVNSDGPVFDFTRVTRRWSKGWRRVTTELLQIGVLVESPARDGLTQDELRTINTAKAEAIGRIDALEAEREALIAEVLVSVPREWLTPDAPDDLDWHKPESLEWLLDAKFDALLQAMAGARQNSPN